MTKKAGFYWHVHHDTLIEWCYDVDERIDYIKSHKPHNEIETRLRWMTPVKGEMPKEFVEAWEARVEAWKALDEARKARNEAWDARDEAWKAYNEACEARDEAWEAYREARKARSEAWEAYREAGKTYNEAWKAYREARKAYKDEIETLHAKEHPDCPWDSETLVFQLEENSNLQSR